MLNEHERDEGPEDGEYHFSDEGSYEMGEEEAKAPVVTEASGLAAKFSSYRRIIIIGAIAAVVFLLAYLIIPPLTSSTPTEITAVNNPPPLASRAVAEAPPKKEKIAVEKVKLVMTETTPKPSAVQAAATVNPIEPILQPPSLESPVAAPEPAARVSAENKAAMDRLTAVEETNTKLIGQLQAEYAQKVADSEAQNKALQDQVRTLNTRLASMEAEMSKLVQTLTNKQTTPATESANAATSGNNSTSTVIAVPGASAASRAYKINYSVQAIIPGRAWLRSESGETITVAEGDMLKSLGRVTKIDPYDGTILIDTGSKLVTLTYGNGEYS